MATTHQHTRAGELGTSLRPLMLLTYKSPTEPSACTATPKR